MISLINHFYDFIRIDRTVSIVFYVLSKFPIRQMFDNMYDVRYLKNKLFKKISLIYNAA